MRRVVVSTNTIPFDIKAICYAHDAINDCLERGEAPLPTSALLLDDMDERDTAEIITSLDVAEAWLNCADALVVFVDQGVPANMRFYIEMARRWAMEVEFRSLPQWATDKKCLPA